MQQIGDFERRSTEGGVELWIHRTPRFKSRLWRISFRQPLDHTSVCRTLAIHLLRRGTTHHRSMREVSRALERLYGASWVAGTCPLGAHQHLRVRLDHVEERHLPGGEAVDQPARELLRQLLFEPALDDDGAFPESAFQTEYRNLQHEFDALYDDKPAWAWRRFLEHWFPGEPWGLPSLGRKEDLEGLDRFDVTEAWRKLLREAPARVMVVGEVDPDEVVDWVSQALPLHSKSQQPAPTPPLSQAPTPRWEIEEDQLLQARLQVGFRVDLQSLSTSAHDALALVSNILGDGFHSRLFRRIREEHSLAYDVSALLDRSKGFLACTAGIDANRREEVHELMCEEIESLRREPPTEEEFERARRSLVGTSRSLRESPEGMLDLLEASLAKGRVRRLEDIVDSFLALGPADVLEAAERIQTAELSYCLVPRGASA